MIYRIIRMIIRVVMMIGERRKHKWKGGMTVMIRIPIRGRICWRVVVDGKRGTTIVRIILLRSLIGIYILQGV